ncbi:hypothetical protein L7F22_002733 [Adiantum nelumboides]|nr:hypothetical protein [Adiantum nelumboides]
MQREHDAKPILVPSSISEQRSPSSPSADDPFPFVFVPASAQCEALPMLVEGILKQKVAIEQALHRSGAVLFRGFQVLTPSDFNHVLDALGYDNFAYRGRGNAQKTAVVGRVVTATDVPVHFPIGFHNEMAYQSIQPSKVVFYCNVEPPVDAGGATPIVQGHVVYERLQKEMPEFLKMIETKGLMYHKFLSNDPSGTRTGSWQAVFKASTKEEAEEKAKASDSHIEWREDDTAMCCLGPRSGVKCDLKRGQRKVWFNSIGATYDSMHTRSSGQDGISFGDGSPLSNENMLACIQIMQQEQTAFRWCKGDVLFFDNLAVLHGREPSKPPRKILAALCAN